MKTPRIAMIALLAAGSLAAETWTGTVIDVMCKDRDAAGHTRQCAISCAKSGFGLVTADGKFLKFDEAGNTKALAMLKSASKDKDLKATVTGKMDGGVIHVDSVALQ